MASGQAFGEFATYTGAHERLNPAPKSMTLAIWERLALPTVLENARL